MIKIRSQTSRHRFLEYVRKVHRDFRAGGAVGKVAGSFYLGHLAHVARSIGDEHSDFADFDREVTETGFPKKFSPKV